MSILTLMPIIAGLTFMISFSISWLMSKAGLTDVPVGRSNHAAPTPPAGGLGVLCGLAAGFVSLTLLTPIAGVFADLPTILSLCFAIALLGIYDDLYSPPTMIKFGIFIGLSFLLIYILGPVTHLPAGQSLLQLPLSLAILGTLLWIFVVINSVNFMDGANGLMPGCMAIAFAGLAAVAHLMQAPQTLLLSLISSAAWAGFLPWNFRRKALIFSGDVGALTAGFIYAAAVLLLCHESANPSVAYLGVLLIFPFIVDVLLTLFWRARHGKNLLSPHRDHLYQRAIKRGVSHTQISAIYYSAFFTCSAIVFMMSTKSQAFISVAFAIMVFIAAILYIAAHKLWSVQD